MLALLGRNEAEEEKVIEGVNECNMSAMLNVPKSKRSGETSGDAFDNFDRVVGHFILKGSWIKYIFKE